MPTHTVSITYTGGGSTVSQNIVLTADSEARQEIAIGSNDTDTEVDVHIPSDEIKAFILLCDQNVTLEYNDNVATNGLITLTADLPYYFYTGAPFALADVMGFAAAAVDVTKFYVTNVTGTTATTLFITTLYDGTP